MGILAGSDIAKIFEYGIFHQNPKSYNINVDGEGIIHKGRFLSNLIAHDPELAIAQSAFQYMHNLINRVKCIFGVKNLKDVIIHMDGPKRFKNKTTKRAGIKEDINNIRNYFKNMSMNAKYSVKEYKDSCEAELMMYLERQRDVNLNIYLTLDSDMMSIMYGHRPIIQNITNNDTDAKIEFERQIVDLCKKPNLSQSNAHSVKNLNHSYTIDLFKNETIEYEIFDSCVWLRNIKSIDCHEEYKSIFYSFDYKDLIFDIKPLIMRAFLHLCGNDYVEPFLTNTMIEKILMLKNDEYTTIRREINKLTKYDEIALSLLWFAFRLGCHPKRITDSIYGSHFSSVRFCKAFTEYNEYINTGNMIYQEYRDHNEESKRLMSYHFTILYIARDFNRNMTKEHLCNWAKRTTLDECLETYRRNICNEKICLFKISTIRETKRKMTTSMAPTIYDNILEHQKQENVNENMKNIVKKTKKRYNNNNNNNNSLNRYSTTLTHDELKCYRVSIIFNFLFFVFILLKIKNLILVIQYIFLFRNNLRLKKNMRNRKLMYF